MKGRTRQERKNYTGKEELDSSGITKTGKEELDRKGKTRQE